MQKLLLTRGQAELPAGGVDQRPTICGGVVLKPIADPPDCPLKFHVLQRPFVTTHRCCLPFHFPGVLRTNPATLLGRVEHI